MPPPSNEPNPPAKDLVKLRTAKPKPAEESPLVEHVQISTERASLGVPKQAPEQPVEAIPVAADQVQLRQAYKPKTVGASESTRIEETTLRETPTVTKTSVASLSISKVNI